LLQHASAARADRVRAASRILSALLCDARPRGVAVRHPAAIARVDGDAAERLHDFLPSVLDDGSRHSASRLTHTTGSPTSRARVGDVFAAAVAYHGHADDGLTIQQNVH
jgi:hypothetical protein